MNHVSISAKESGTINTDATTLQPEPLRKSHELRAAILLGLWWGGMIGAIGSLTNRESHPIDAFSLLAFYVIEVGGDLLRALWGSLFFA